MPRCKSPSMLDIDFSLRSHGLSFERRGSEQEEDQIQIYDLPSPMIDVEGMGEEEEDDDEIVVLEEFPPLANRVDVVPEKNLQEAEPLVGQGSSSQMGNMDEREDEPSVIVDRVAALLESLSEDDISGNGNPQSIAVGRRHRSSASSIGVPPDVDISRTVHLQEEEIFYNVSDRVEQRDVTRISNNPIVGVMPMGYGSSWSLIGTHWDRRDSTPVTPVAMIDFVSDPNSNSSCRKRSLCEKEPTTQHPTSSKKSRPEDVTVLPEQVVAAALTQEVPRIQTQFEEQNKKRTEERREGNSENSLAHDPKRSNESRSRTSRWEPENKSPRPQQKDKAPEPRSRLELENKSPQQKDKDPDPRSRWEAQNKSPQQKDKDPDPRSRWEAQNKSPQQKDKDPDPRSRWVGQNKSPQQKDPEPRDSRERERNRSHEVRGRSDHVQEDTRRRENNQNEHARQNHETELDRARMAGEHRNWNQNGWKNGSRKPNYRNNYHHKAPYNNNQMRGGYRGKKPYRNNYNRNVGGESNFYDRRNDHDKWYNNNTHHDSRHGRERVPPNEQHQSNRNQYSGPVAYKSPEAEGITNSTRLNARVGTDEKNNGNVNNTATVVASISSQQQSQISETSMRVGNNNNNEQRPQPPRRPSLPTEKRPYIDHVQDKNLPKRTEVPRTGPVSKKSGEESDRGSCIQSNSAMNSSNLKAAGSSRASTITNRASYQFANLTKVEKDDALKNSTKEILDLIQTCRKCEQSFDTREKANQHLKNSHRMKLCYVCFEAFPVLGWELKKHFVEKHTNGEESERAPCPLCLEKFAIDGIYHHLSKAHLIPYELERIKQTQPGTKNSPVNKKQTQNHPNRSVSQNFYSQNYHQQQRGNQFQRGKFSSRRVNVVPYPKRWNQPRKVSEENSNIPNAKLALPQPLLQNFPSRSDDVEHNIAHASRNEIKFKIPKKNLHS